MAKAAKKKSSSSKKGAKKTRKATSTAKKSGSKKASPKKKRATSSSSVGGSLLIVESPAKAKTIGRYVGNEFKVCATVGHLKDLPKSELGIDIENGFEPTYSIIQGKSKYLNEIRKAYKKAKAVYLAPDPDREGEAIAWHVRDELDDGASSKPFYRVLINEITKNAVREAVEHPIELNRSKFESQQTRRILDRLVGYKISPLLWDKIRRGLSAGRVQSVALRLICEREKEIKAFNPEEYWSVEGLFSKGENPEEVVAGKLTAIDGEKPKIGNAEQAGSIHKEIEAQKFSVAKIEEKKRVRNPFPPFITSTMQQEAFRKFRFSAKRTMVLAQHLYEGIDLGDEGPVGLVTYMRTDSTRVSDVALKEAREFILEHHGTEYTLETPRIFKSKKNVQDAHEAIRPTSLQFTPSMLKKHLDKDHFRLYELIWNRFLASQMTQARFAQKSIDMAGGKYTFRATGSTMLFDGFLSLYDESTDESASDEKSRSLPDLREGEDLDTQAIEPKQHFTQPPPRYTESTLIRELEEKGIGRPSTYATILGTIQNKDYTEKDGLRFKPTELGMIVNDLLVESFPDILDVGFTANMEDQLDQVEDGTKDWRSLLNDFYSSFDKDLQQAKTHMRDIKREETPTDFVCEKCQSGMVIKWGKNGYFLACSGYPDCKNTKEFRRLEDGSIEIVKEETTDETCDECSSPMVVKRGRFGKFLACSRYPDCRGTKSISTGVPCPEEGCEGDFVEKRSRSGRAFFGCNKYPKCTRALWYRPIAKACPDCKTPFLIEKIKKSGHTYECHVKECSYKEAVDQ